MPSGIHVNLGRGQTGFSGDRETYDAYKAAYDEVPEKRQRAWVRRQLRELFAHMHDEVEAAEALFDTAPEIPPAHEWRIDDLIEDLEELKEYLIDRRASGYR